MIKKVYLEITNVCNMSCSFCHGTKRPPRFISEDEFKIALEKLKGKISYLYFHLMGEPTLHPQLSGFLALAHNYGFKVILTTNGTLLKEKSSILLSSAALHKVSVSLHSFEANDIDLSLDGYLGDVFDFCRGCAAAGKIAVMRLWNRGGREDLNCDILSKMKEYFPGEWKESYSGLKLSERIYLEWGEKFDWPDIKGSILNENGFCYGLRDQVGVLCDGSVVPCCLDRNGDITLGNLFDSSLEEILLSKRARELYDGFTSHICSEELCKRCMRASYYRRAEKTK